MSEIIINKLEKVYPNGFKAVHGIDLKIEDGEFSSEDAVDQFVRFIKLGAIQKGVELSEQDTDKIELLVLTTLEKFNSKKPKQINIAVNKFNAMNHR